MTPTSRRIALITAFSAALAPVGAPAAAAVAAPAALTATLLPSAQPTTWAVDVTELGVVVGTAGPPEGTNPITNGTTPQRWVPVPTRGWVRQQLTLPAGATGVGLAGVNELGEAAGDVGVGEATSQPVRWSISGTRTTPLGPPGASAAASGLNRWIVAAGDGTFGGSTLVARDGTRTELTGTPELEGTTAVRGNSVGVDGTLLLTAVRGIGRASIGRPVIWKDGATVELPVFSSYFTGGACTSRVQPDGAVAYSGFVWGEQRYEIGIHRGGVPGTNTPLPVAAGRGTTLNCATGDVMAIDGTVLGELEPPPGEGVPVGATQAVIWRPDGTLVPIPVEADEIGTAAIAVASGGRALIQAYPRDAAPEYFVWKAGVRRQLTIPAGWSLDRFVELTETGVVVANLRNADGRVRPAVWRT